MLGFSPLASAPLSDDGAIIVYDLSGVSVVAGSPTVGTSSISQDHDLTLVGLTSGSPLVQSSTIAQDHNITSNSVTTGAPVVGVSSYTQTVACIGNNVVSGQPDQFPYSVGQFRRDNPQTSFPKVIPDEIMRRYGVFPVEELAKPAFDPLVQTLKRDALPHKEIIRLKTEEDATNPITGEVDQAQVGQPIYGNRWFIGYTVENKPQDQAEQAIRNNRNRLLSDTDWMALSDNTMTPEWSAYRQALRDITTQDGFPYSVVWPTKP